MNSASQNFPHHLGALRQRMLHPTDYELAVNYFLEEFAGDMAFVRGSEPEQMPHLVAVLNIVVSKAMGRHVEVENTLVSHLRDYRFVHGNAQADGRVVLFFYFDDADTGLLMLIPGIRGQMGGCSVPSKRRSARPAVELIAHGHHGSRANREKIQDQPELSEWHSMQV